MSNLKWNLLAKLLLVSLKRSWILLFIIFLPFSVSAQISTYEDQLQFEINKRGISEQEFRELLIDSGIDPDRLDILNANELLAIQQLIEDFERERFFNQRNVINQDTSDLETIDEDLVEMEMDSLDSLGVTIDTVAEFVFGHDLFRSGQISLIEPEEGFAPPEMYVLGSGDALTVSIFGFSRVEENTIVQNDGSVRIRDGNVRVTVGGLNLQEARIKLERAYRQEYRFTPNQFNLYISSIRNIRVSVFGEIQTPGDYTVSAANGVTNLLAAAGGLTDNGSVRNIQVVKRTGETLNFDLYNMLSNPGQNQGINLEDGDLIAIPALGNVVSIDGAIRRAHRYELKVDEGLFDLIEYAGGLTGNANLGSVSINRFENNRRVVKDVPYAERVKSNRDYELFNGDEVMIKKIEEELENYVSVSGEVRNEGNYELIEGLTLKDVIQLAGIKSSTKMDFALLKRIDEFGSANLIRVSLNDALNDQGNSALIMMQDRDELIIWPKERFIDNKYIKVAGAVRIEEEFEYDEGGTIRAKDLIQLAGGLRSDAASFAHVHRLDPLNPNERRYIRIDLDRMMSDDNSADNVFLEPYDSLYVYSRNEFQDDLYVKVSGAVNNPGNFIYGQEMTLKDAIIMAGGFKRSSATNRIEISRVIFEDNSSTKTVIHEVPVQRNELNKADANEFVLEPYDNVFVRYVPQYELQQNVVVQGEVTLPGEYSLIKDNETVFDIIQRAGGITEEAFPGAAKLYRSEDSIGYIVMRLDEVLENPQSRYNYTLVDGDTIFIPKVYEYVRIVGATQYLTQNQEKWLNAPFHAGKDALFYINNYAGGFADNARKDKVFVKYPNGEVKTSNKRFLLGRKYPEVLPGSEISVWTIRNNFRENQDKEEVNWTKVLGDSVAQAMSILTLILLVQRLD